MLYGIPAELKLIVGAAKPGWIFEMCLHHLTVRIVRKSRVVLWWLGWIRRIARLWSGDHELG